jgi:hypothetical protein
MLPVTAGNTQGGVQGPMETRAIRRTVIIALAMIALSVLWYVTTHHAVANLAYFYHGKAVHIAMGGYFYHG